MFHIENDFKRTNEKRKYFKDILFPEIFEKHILEGVDQKKNHCQVS